MARSRKQPSSPHIAAIAFALLCVASCGSLFSSQLITQEKLWDAVRPGTVTPLAELLPEVGAAYVCAMGPYEETTRDTTPEGTRINEHLRNIHYQSDEGHWILAIALPDRIEVSRFSRSANLDFDSGGQLLKGGQAAAVPGNFSWASCMPLERAAFLWSRAGDRTYGTFGAKTF